ncbi:MAG: hypothetical protein DHS80DRAFT_23739 [Piptocephalis tieghemiana]|nr:MAG: hypothetical protein DHS80DRAFT_23739 [Piptocephalis tieghemiana]
MTHPSSFLVTLATLALGLLSTSSQASPFFDMRHHDTFTCTGLDESVNPVLHNAFSAISHQAASAFCTRLGPKSEAKHAGSVGISQWRSWTCQDGPDASEAICALDKVLDRLAKLEPYAGYTLEVALSR